MLGLLILGFRVMETVGKKVVKLDYPKGFCAQFSTAIAVICGSLLGLPLSSSHCTVGSLFGIILANKIAFIRNTYDGEGSEENKRANGGTIKKILVWWIATVPVTVLVAMGLTWLCLLKSEV